MNHADFVHLHNHSDYSLLDGASSIPRMVERAAEMRMPALALTDHGSLFGAVEFYQEARRAGVKPILGMEAYVTRGDRRERTRDTAHHLVLLARDEQGFKNLMRLSSFAFLEGFYYKPRVDHALLAQHAAGLLALSACPKGEVASDLLEDNEERACQTAIMYRDMFGAENYFLEVQNHGLEIEDKIRERVAGLARRTGIPRVATNDCHYLRHEDADAHDVLLCIQTGKTVDDPKRMQMNTDQLFFRSPDEMKAAFAGDPEVIRNTLAVAERCNLQLAFGRPLLPEFPLPEGEASPEDYLCAMARKELEQRLPGGGASTRERLEYELEVICRMGFASYFLIVRDFIAYAREQGIAVGPGRGSVAGSLVAYVLRITDIDPIQHGLIFERFLNPERVSMPDIDIDFDDLRRGEVIEYVKRKYGDGNVTQIITFGTMGAKGVVRDVGRALGMAFAEVDRIAKLVPDGLNMTLERALELSPDLKNLPQRGPAHARLLKSARALEGLARHASTHAAGVLITPGPLLDYVPLYRQKDESITTQWDMKAVEKAGLLKMDFLGLRTLSVLQQAVARVEEKEGVKLDLRALPLDDPAAYEIFQRADTVGIFQFESSGMRDYLRQLKPTVFEDLVAMNALYRPGPMEHIPFFIDCKHGKQVARYEHPDLEPILHGTYGVFVFQEQVMQAANVLAGFSMAQADELRRAMGKKRPEEMEAKRAQFVEGCKKNRIPAAKAEKIFATMEKFAGYGFNRCVTGMTRVADAISGEVTTVEDLFHHRREYRIHALGEDWKLKPRRVTDVVWNGRKAVFEIRTAQGKRITATANHPFRTLDGWKRLDELGLNDRIAAPRRLDVPAKESWPAHEIITLAGLLSEGNLCHPSTLYFYGNSAVQIHDFASAIGQFPNTVARIDCRANGQLEVAANLGRHWRVREDAAAQYSCEGNLAVVLDRVRSGAFLWAERLGILGKKAIEKRVPVEVFSLRDEDLELFLGRLWAGDGYICNETQPTPFYATFSEGLADDVQLLLLRLGIPSTIHRKAFRYRGTSRPGYTVHPMGESGVESFAERVAPHALGREKAAQMLLESLGNSERGRTSKDTIPPEVCRWVNEERTRLGLTWREAGLRSGVGMNGFMGNGARRRRGFLRGTIRKLAQLFASERLARIADSDVYWDRIVSIEPRGVQDTYDLTVEHDHNFVANGLIVHNSHSAAYAMLAYQTAYLKSHFPAEFMAAALTSELADSARIVTLIEECRRMRLEILPPDVNRSTWRFTLEDGRIRFGLGAVRNVGQASVEAIVTARAGEGAFRDLFDLAMRVDARALNRRVLESLIAAGACDGLGPERGAMHAGAGRVLEQAAALQRERDSGQSSLFGEEGGVAVVAPPPPEGPPWSGSDRSAREKEVLGFYFSEHPLEPLRETLARLVTHTVGEALELEDGAEVRVGAVVIDVKRLTTRAGKPMASVTLEDLTGRIECTVFPDTWETARALLEEDRVVVVSGRVEVREDRGLKLLLAEARSLEQARSEYRQCLHLEIRSENLSVGWFEEVDEALSGFPGDADVYLHIVLPDHSRKASRSKRYRVAEDERVVATLKQRFPFVRVGWGKGMA
jgi:DNA polymerase-3 subunit alpha